MVSAFNYQTYILNALRAGAAGYLTKDTPIEELKAAVRVAYTGGGIIDRSIASNMIRHLADREGKAGEPVPVSS